MLQPLRDLVCGRRALYCRILSLGPGPPALSLMAGPGFSNTIVAKMLSGMSEISGGQSHEKYRIGVLDAVMRLTIAVGLVQNESGSAKPIQ